MVPVLLYVPAEHATHSDMLLLSKSANPAAHISHV
eukprot:COSAG01_NODE_36677_length_514_cov_0.597590_1_plen_34_part_01